MHLLRAVLLYILWKLKFISTCGPFSHNAHLYKSKAEYIRKFDEGAVFGNFAQEVFQLEHYEDREIIAPVQ